MEDYLGYELDAENSSFEFTGPTLSETFYRQLLIAIFFAFLFMAVVVFLLFRKIVPSLAVIISAFADILMTLTLVDILGIKMSSAGIVAFLMLIGYSVDTDILLTNRVLKTHQGTLNEKIYSAFKTGMTMTLTSLLVAIIALIIGQAIDKFSFYLIPLTAGGFIYIAASDLIPQLHKEKRATKSVQELLALLLGIGIMYALLFVEVY